MGKIQSTLSEEDIQEINHLASREPSFIQNYLKNKCYGWKNTEVQIGIIGESHRGKSSFINAARGLKPTDAGAAKVKNKECTKEPKIYEYPNNSKIKLVDLPGTNTINFPIETYLDEMNCSRFDFFLILSKDSFTKNDAYLAKKLNEKGKEFFFVRTFMDTAVADKIFDNGIEIKTEDEDGNLTNEMKAFMDEEMEETKAYCRENLTCSGVDTALIYCISNRFPDRFEFSNLILDVSLHLSEIQRQALTYSTDIITDKIFSAKKKILQEQIKYYAALSGIAGLIPIPGVDIIADVSLIMHVLKSYKQQFHIDYEQDEDGVFYRNGLPISRDINFIRNKEKEGGLSLLRDIANIGKQSYVIALIAEMTGSQAVEQTSKILATISFGIFAGFGSVIGGVVSYASTYYILLTELDKIEKLANKAMKLKIQELLH